MMKFEKNFELIQPRPEIMAKALEDAFMKDEEDALQVRSETRLFKTPKDSPLGIKLSFERKITMSPRLLNFIKGHTRMGQKGLYYQESSLEALRMFRKILNKTRLVVLENVDIPRDYNEILLSKSTLYPHGRNVTGPETVIENHQHEYGKDLDGDIFGEHLPLSWHLDAHFGTIVHSPEGHTRPHKFWATSTRQNACNLHGNVKNVHQALNDVEPQFRFGVDFSNPKPTTAIIRNKKGSWHLSAGGRDGVKVIGFN